MGQAQTYCFICGAPMLEGISWRGFCAIADFKSSNALVGRATRGDHIKWLTFAILLTNGHTTERGVELDKHCPPSPRTWYSFHLELYPPEGQRSVYRLEARSHRNLSSGVLEWGKPVDTTRGNPAKETYPLGVPLFVLVHFLCLQLADRFINSLETLLHMAQVIPLDASRWPKIWRRYCIFSFVEQLVVSLRGFTRAARIFWQQEM